MTIQNRMTLARLATRPVMDSATRTAVEMMNGKVKGWNLSEMMNKLMKSRTVDQIPMMIKLAFIIVVSSSVPERLG